MIDVVKVLLPATAAFAVGIALTPVVAHFLYRHKAWKKKSVGYTTDGHEATLTRALHNDEGRRTPRMGGIVVWGSVALVTTGFWLFSALDGALGEKLNFLSRGQTWLPLAALLVGALIGLVDDLLAVLD
ncbi:hypothetical protein GVX82_05200, partial [Patescibacteria group bacterium]|nr:hypothetical protein [Patescibacteria group bacterium]